jgi:hypothetical protein
MHTWSRRSSAKTLFDSTVNGFHDFTAASTISDPIDPSATTEVCC